MSVLSLRFGVKCQLEQIYRNVNFVLSEQDKKGMYEGYVKVYVNLDIECSMPLWQSKV